MIIRNATLIDYEGVYKKDLYIKIISFPILRMVML